jgi:two-component system NtrC family response regulator
VVLVGISDSSVLLLGETGTGKELFARAVHENSNRSGHPLIVVDCTNLPGPLAESILFGHAKGSFTGAVESTDGLFKQADKGTIFLDEIGELDLNVQKSLLRVIQERRFRPLSAKKEVECDFRIIAATNRDLESMVREGKFRADLYHRINTRAIVLPTLRERKEDIPLLAAFYTEHICANLGCDIKEMAEETIAAFKLYPWPGNIRELANIVHVTVLNGIAERKLYPQHLPEEIRLFLIRSKITSQDLLNNASSQRPWTGIVSGAWQSVGGSGADAVKTAPYAGTRGAENQDGAAGNKSLVFAAHDSLPSLKQAREEIISKMEYSYLSELIRRCEGNFTAARNLSGLSRARLYELLQKHSLSLEGGSTKTRDNPA